MFGSKRRVKDEMEIRKDRTVRFHPDEKQNPIKSIYQVSKPGGVNRLGLGKSRAFSEDHEPWRKRIFDPGSEIILKWNYIFLVSCLVALFIDPLYFYLPSVENGATTSCIKMDKKLNIIVTFFRSLADLFYILHMVIKFRTAYVAPSSSVFGRGELVMDPKKIARKYLTTDFFVDLAAALPLPQIVIWLVIPAIKNSNAERTNNALALIVLVQYVPRLYLIFPLSGQIVKATGVVTETALAGAVYNLLLFVIAGHVAGAAWYLLSVERQTTCWRSYCGTESSSLGCVSSFLNCDTPTSTAEQNWANSTQVFANCDASNSSISFKFGIFASALNTGAVSSDFIIRYLFCYWWGLQNLSTFGQSMSPSIFSGETSFGIVVIVVGLVLFAGLIGNMQTYLQSVTIRLEEWRLKRRDTEVWMKHRQLPHNLRHRVRRFVQYKWLTTRGVDEVAILEALPSDLRRDIQRHLCLDLVLRVPFFSQMDDLLLDAICERLVSSLCTEGTYIVREGDPVNEMLFIIRGQLESSTTNGGRTGFFNSITLHPGDFCGEELLTWALPKSTVNLPTSTRTVRALVEVEAFALRAEDLKFVANQFRRLHSKQLQHTFRFYSHHWRTWAACFIQAAWRRFKRRRMAKDSGMRELSLSTSFASSTNEEESHADESMEIDGERLRLSITDGGGFSQLRSNLTVMMLASKFAASTRKGTQKMKGSSDMPRLQKPDEPDFFTDAYD